MTHVMKGIRVLEVAQFTTRAPQASEHTEIVLMELGFDWDRIEALKSKGAIA